MTGLDRLDVWLGRITLYRLTLYYLAALVLVAVGLAAVGSLPVSPWEIGANLFIALATAHVVNKVLARLTHASTNTDSSLITGLILSLIVPATFPGGALFLLVATAVAVASKYVLTVENQNVFNPAAVAVVAIGLLVPDLSPTWWVGTVAFLPVVVPGGLLILRKVRRGRMVSVFLGVYMAAVALSAAWNGSSFSEMLGVLRFSVANSAVLFFALVMLTEPSTTPATRSKQDLYAVGVALLYATPQFGVAAFALTPELSLVIGNLVFFVLAPRFRFDLPMVRKRRAGDTYVLEFEVPRPVSFGPGQYLEWALPHARADSRGERRQLSIASSPAEKNLMVVVRVPPAASSYKRALRRMRRGDRITASRLSGDFTLPGDRSKPLAFLAAGVGIAPFRSMLQHIVDGKTRCDIVLIYVNRHTKDMLFGEVFEKARPLGLRVVYSLTDEDHVPNNWSGQRGHVTASMVQAAIPDWARRKFFLAGPQTMVNSIESELRSLGVDRREVVTDHFPGYAEQGRVADKSPVALSKRVSLRWGLIAAGLVAMGSIYEVVLERAWDAKLEDFLIIALAFGAIRWLPARWPTIRPVEMVALLLSSLAALALEITGVVREQSVAGPAMLDILVIVLLASGMIAVALRGARVFSRQRSS